jgi:murein DD-endopeptidase MepM/ murein hydrolase activator NlpD
MAYEVVKGDTLGAIAAANGTTVEALMKANPQITNKNSIQIGWSLTIPGEESAETETGITTGSTKGLLSVAGDPEIWNVSGQAYIVYTVPDSEPPIYISWSIDSEEDLQSIFGPDQKIVYDREITTEKYAALGAIDFGNSNELANFDEDPFTSWTSTMEVQSLTQPWILDDDYQALIAMAMLEERTLTEADIATTEWWQTHTAAERDWMVTFHGDPTTADRLLEDNRIATLQLLHNAGIENPSEDLVQFMADQVTMGMWSSVMFNDQVKAIADPQSGIEIDAELAVYLEEGQGVTLGQTEEVRTLVNEWLGPVYGKWTDEQVNEWAGKLRNDPDGATNLVDKLRNQRLAVFGGYEDPNLTYQDIASPWRSFGQALWGQKMDETSGMFQTMLTNNDAALNGQLLRQEGLDQKVGKVVDDANAAMRNSVGGTLRRAI